MKPDIKKVFKWVFWLTALYLLVTFTVPPASGVELNIPIPEETLFKATMAAVGGGILGGIIFGIVFALFGIVFALKWIKKVWAKNVETDSTTGSDKKDPAIKKRTNLEYTTSTEKTTTPKNPSYESMVPKKAKEFEHNNAPADGVSTKKLFCTQCGIKNQSDAKFCWKCGHAMHRDEGLG